MEDTMLNRIIRGILIEAGAIILLCLGLLIARSTGSDAAAIATLAGIGGLASWSLLSMFAILVSFNLIDA